MQLTIGNLVCMPCDANSTDISTMSRQITEITEITEIIRPD